ncbi:SdiA-regulated domain-containing protein [Dyadobacter sp. CY323]|uniref:SdiA-regulated domain-containing protein n=1 Tax=Dyadobacter sp. CY323 TaxID=2907302 RepID=UPI001F44EC03|nr:SdiA-regulated domain-containing protein [Dyadobacter sp. CY323]MCE6989383.1 SdiA-regulated domain-containing protein [Dyadobacter sp. CY323]
MRMLRPWISNLLIACSLLGCNPTEKKEVAGQDYDLENPDKFNMPESLFEISGITLLDGKSDTIYAVQDEEGKVFRLAWDIGKQVHTKFSKKGDYEDLAILNSEVFVLKSNGVLFSYPLSESAFEEAENVTELKHVLPKGEYEGMYADPASGDLYVICKNCPAGDPKASVTGYIFNPKKDSLEAPRTFNVQVDEIKAITGKVSRGFRPSGLAKNPVTGEWYIISSVNKLLVVTDANWKVKKAFPLNGNLFIQPEGIAFDKSGSLYISNEGDDLFSGNILKFKRLKR